MRLSREIGDQSDDHHGAKMSKRVGSEMKDERYSKKAKCTDSKLALRFEDHIKAKQDEMKKPAKDKKTADDLKTFDSFGRVSNKRLDLRLYNHDWVNDQLCSAFDLTLGLRGARTRLNDANSVTFQELVGFVFDNDTLDAWIEFNVIESDKLPKLFYKEDQGVLVLFCSSFAFFSLLGKKRRAVLEFFAVKLHMIGNPRARLADHFGKSRNMAIHGVLKVTDHWFEQMHQNFHLPLQLYGLFSEKFSKLVCSKEGFLFSFTVY